ncbi:ACT domain-containing protein [Haliangium sp.]|uniref:ACT domain-containing protein n=1 Tax=Haliangium sp. TaxID=2663208 RepID=UPI003D0E1711
METDFVTHITVERSRARIVLTVHEAHWANLVEELEASDVPVDSIDLSYAHHQTPIVQLMLTLDTAELARVRMHIQARLGDAGEYDFAQEGELALVSLIGHGVSSDLAIADKVMATLAAQGIGVRELSTREDSIACLVAPESADRAAIALQRAFGLHEQAA